MPKKFKPLIAALSRVFLVLILFAFFLIPPLGVSAAGEGGTFPDEPFNGMQITYQISGASVSESEETHDFTTSRVLKGELGKGKLTITGTAKMGSGYSADVTASVSCGDKTDVFTTNIPTGFPNFNEESFSISVPIPKGATQGSFSISMVGHYNAGTRGLIVSGEFTKKADGSSADNDKNNNQEPEGVQKSVEVLGGVGNIPGPQNSVEALVGILVPGLLTTLMAALAGLFGNGAPPPDFPPSGTGPSGGGPLTTEEPEWMEIQLSPMGSKTVIEKNPETGQWINIQTGGVFDLDMYRKNFPQEMKDYEKNARRDLEIERSGKTAMQESLNEIRREYEQREATFEWLQKIQKASQRQGLDTSGAANNMYGRIREEIDKLSRGEEVDFDRVARIRNFIGAYTAGEYGSEDAARSASEALKPNEVLSIFDIGAVTDRELWGEAAAETGRNIATLNNSDGSFSWKGLAGRVGINLLTFGKAEKAFDVMAGLYATKDAVDAGETSIGAFTAGAKTVVNQFVVGKAIGTGVKAAGGIVGGFSKTGVSGAIKGGKDGLVSSGRELVTQAKDLVSKNAWKNTASGAANSVKEGATRLKNIITGKEGYGSTTGPKAPTVPAKPSWDQKTANELTSAVKSGDPKRMAEVYNKIGRNEVSKLQVKGAVSGETVEKFNRVIGSQVNDIVDKSTTETIESFQKIHRVRVSEIVIADSGSSAKGSVKRALTDFDRTTIPKFDKADVLKYAEAKNISPERAYNQLCEEFKNSFDSNVKNSLKNSGLSENAVKFDSYDRIGVGSQKMDIGVGSKNIDTYGAGYTGARLSTQGKAKVFKVDANGNIDKVYNVSGQSALDRSVLNNQEYVTKGDFPQTPTLITQSDAKLIIQRQVENVGSNPNNLVEIAKSIGRAEKGIKVLSNSSSSLQNPNLTKAAAFIYENPSNTKDILVKFGFVDAAGNADVNAFSRAGIEAVNKAGQVYAG